MREESTFTFQKRHVAAFLLICLLLLLPFFVDLDESYLGYFLFLTFLYITMSQGWNLAGGYAGQASMGQHAFFGLGGYIVAFSWLGGWSGYLSPIGLLSGGLGAAALSIVVGLPLLSKLKGDYFALGTLGLGEILRVVFIQGKSITGGAAGLMLPSASYDSLRPYYYIALIICLLSCGAVYVLVRTRIGLALVAIRENEQTAAANGVNVLKYKVLAFSVGAFFTGMCGGVYAYYVFHIEPMGFFNLNWALLPLVMTILGGIGTFIGPIIGALVLAVIVEMTNIWLPEIHTVFYGGFIIAVILFLPRGIMGLGVKFAKMPLLDGISIKLRKGLSKGGGF